MHHRRRRCRHPRALWPDLDRPTLHRSRGALFHCRVPRRLRTAPPLGGVSFASAQDAPCCRFHPTYRRDCAPLVGVERAPAIIEWWSQQGSGVVRVTAVLVLALGDFFAYACAPARRAV